MTTTKLPSQYELCRIAAALFGRKAIHEPVKAARAALGLWLATGYEISKAKQRDLDDNVFAYSEHISVLGGSLAEEILNDKNAEDRRIRSGKEIAFGDSAETSEAMKWLNDNVPTGEKGFKTFRNLELAWEKAFGEYDVEARAVCCIGILKKFNESRVEMRRAADAERKRRKRATNGSSNLLSKEIVSGQEAKTHRTLSKKPLA